MGEAKSEMIEINNSVNASRPPPHASRFFVFWPVTGMLWRRELKRFYRDRSRVAGALVPPVLFWLLIGFGLGDSFRAPGSASGITYLEYFFPGTVVLVVLFTSIFSTISIIEDRREGFLQSVLASPASPLAVALGKIAGSATLGFFQGLMLVAVAPFLGLPVDPARAGLAFAILALISFGLSGLGFWLAWRLDSTQGFHAIMNIFLIPMWLLSGALFPAAGANHVIAGLMKINPLTYGVAAFQRSLFAPGFASSVESPSMGACFSVVGLFAALTLAAATAIVKKRR